MELLELAISGLDDGTYWNLIVRCTFFYWF